MNYKVKNMKSKGKNRVSPKLKDRKKTNLQNSRKQQM